MFQQSYLLQIILTFDISIIRPEKEGLWIRIRMDLHSFSLLDSSPDPGGKKSCFVTTTRLSFFACQKDAAGAGAALKKAAPALVSGQRKISSGSTLKVAAPGGSGSRLHITGTAFELSFLSF